MTWELSGEYKGGGRRIGCEQSKSGSGLAGIRFCLLTLASRGVGFPGGKDSEFLCTQQDIPNEVRLS